MARKSSRLGLPVDSLFVAASYGRSRDSLAQFLSQITLAERGSTRPSWFTLTRRTPLSDTL